MYGGLFGDLPAAKADSKKLGGNESSNAADEPAKVLTPPSSNSIGTAAAPLAQPTPSFLPRFVPPQAARRGRQPQSKPRKRTLEASADLKRSPPETTPSVHTTSSVNAQPMAETNTGEQSDNNVREKYYSWHIEASNEEKHENYPSSQFSDSVDAGSDLFAAPTAQPQEPEHLQLLHERAKNQDPYDPLLPNDLLQYWEYKSLAVERERLFREQQESMREKEELLQQLARERQQLEKAGDYDRLVEHQLKQRGSMTGRGRGLSNLPAWLVEKQKKEAQERQQLHQQEQQG